MKNQLITGLLIISSYGNLFLQTILDKYVREGLRNNLRLYQKSYSTDLATESIGEARGKYLPKIESMTRNWRVTAPDIVWW